MNSRWALLGPPLLLLLPAPALAHGLAASGDEHLPGWLTVLVAVAAATLPLWLGALGGMAVAAPVRNARRVHLDGFASGILIFLLWDFAGLSANLGLGMGAPLLQSGLLGAFAVGLVLPALAGAGAGPALGTALWWAAGVGLHTLGEGLVMGHNLNLGLAVALRPLPLASFTLHKLAEGFTVGALLGPAPGRRSLAAAVALGGLPAAAGALGGYLGLPGLAGNFAYALGAGALAWVLPRFAASYRAEPQGHALGAAAGVVLMYLAAWLHQI